MNVSIPSGRLWSTRAMNESIPSLYKLSCFPFPFSMSLLRMNTETLPTEKHTKNLIISCISVAPPMDERDEGIKSNKLTESMTAKDSEIEKVMNSSFFFTGMNIPRTPNIVEKPAMDAKIKGHTISIRYTFPQNIMQKSSTYYQN